MVYSQLYLLLFHRRGGSRLSVTGVYSHDIFFLGCYERWVTPHRLEFDWDSQKRQNLGSRVFCCDAFVILTHSNHADGGAQSPLPCP